MRSPGPIARGLVVFGLLFAVAAAWALATPLFGAPDEPVHAIRAASVARGQVVGRSVPGQPRAYTEVRAPALFERMGRRTACWAFQPDRTPSCLGAFTGPRGLRPVQTYVGRYLPVYYALVGWPTLLSVTADGVYLMRLTGAAAAAGLLAGAVLVARGARRPVLALLGVGLALTPMVGFLAGTVNPNGLEVAAAVCLWAAALRLAESGAGRPATSVVVAATAGACGLALSRGLSLLWLALVAAIVGLAAPGWRDRLAGWRGDRRLVAGGVVAGATAAAAGLWVLVAGGLDVAPVGVKVSGTADALSKTAGLTWSYLREMVGVFQWRDTPAPRLTYLAWLAAVVTLVALALAAGRGGRPRLALLACVALTLLAPFLQVPRAESDGLVWAGRYTLPLAVGVPMLAAFALAEAGEGVIAAARRLAPWLVAACAVATVAAFWWAARRNAVGLSGPVLFFGREQWVPPVPAWALLALLTAATAALTVLYLGVVRRDRPPIP